MNLKQVLYSTVAIAGICALGATVLAPANAQPKPRTASITAAVAIDADDIGGVVKAPNGKPEAGVWVIAETTDLPTRFTRSVVTDDQGRYVIPDLPTANYQIWVRGYGLVDSPKMRAKPGQQLNHTSVPAPTPAAAAHYYPAIYWYVMMKLPPEKDFGGSTDIPKNITRDTWRQRMNNVDCIGCHQLGQESTRTIPAQFGKFESGAEAWQRRIQAGQSGEMMTNRIAGQLGGAPYKYFGDWTDRVAKGELPKNKPARPAGLERNLVVTTWDWSKPDKYLHDLISSDRRKPTVNAGGPLYGAPEYATDEMPILDPKTHKVSFFKMPVADPSMPVSLGPGHAGAIKPTTPSAYWGDAILWDTKANQHNAMFDDKGRVWLAANIRGLDNPAWCKKGSEHPSAKVVPIDRSSRQAAVYDPKTKEYKFIDTCFGTHHPQFGYDADNTLWMSGTGPVAGWINTKVFDETGSSEKAVGWFPFVLDTNGNGKLDEFGDKTEEGKDTRFNPGSGPYAVMPHPTDGSIWYTSGVFGGRPGFLRFDPKTKLQRVLRSAEGGDRAARRRHRQGRRAVRLGFGRSPDRVRPDQVQAAAQRAERQRPALPRGLHAAQVSGTWLRRRAEFERGGELLHLGRSPQRGGARRERADLDGEPAGRLCRAGQRQDGPDARAVPDGLLRQGSRCPHRRCERRLEGPRPVERLRRPHALAQRARQGRVSDGRAHPGAARSAGEVAGSNKKQGD